MILPPISAESSDEGLGSMSPEPVGIVQVSVINQVETSTSELRRQLERERGVRMLLEDQIRQLEGQLVQQQQQQVRRGCRWVLWCECCMGIILICR